MLAGGRVTPTLLALWKERFADVPLYCRNEIVIGNDVIEQWRDFTFHKSTEDQKRIEQYLKYKCNGKSNLLHIGIGNSGLAQDFCASVSMTVGITIQENEANHALALQIHNYFPLVINKFSSEFSNLFPASFDFIIDNNPSCFCCCFLHFVRMMTSYQAFLRDGGEIVTDRIGLSWTIPGGNGRWSFDLGDWTQVAAALGLVAEDVDGQIFTMRLPSRSTLPSAPTVTESLVVDDSCPTMTPVQKLCAEQAEVEWRCSILQGGVDLRGRDGRRPSSRRPVVGGWSWPPSE